MAEEPLSVAVIDDHELVRDGLTALIGGQGLAEIRYSGGSVQAAAESGAQVALLDIDLGPQAPGVAQSTAILRGAGTQVLLISAFEEPAAVRGAMREGALGFIPKRASFEVLSEALTTVAAGELFLSVDLASILAASGEMPSLSPRELDALRLYASGLKLAAVAHRMGVSPHTAKEYLDRVRAKYAAVGRRARTRTELYVEAQRDGLLGH